MFILIGFDVWILYNKCCWLEYMCYFYFEFSYFRCVISIYYMVLEVCDVLGKLFWIFILFLREIFFYIFGYIEVSECGILRWLLLYSLICCFLIGMYLICIRNFVVLYSMYNLYLKDYLYLLKIKIV